MNNQIIRPLNADHSYGGMERDTTDIGTNMYHGTTLDHTYLENSEVYMCRDPVIGNIVLCKYILYNLLQGCGLKMSGAFIGGNLFICNIIVNKASLGNGWLGINQNERLQSRDFYIMRQALPLRQNLSFQER